MNEPIAIYNDLVGRRVGKKRAGVAKEEVKEGTSGCEHSAVEGPEVSVVGSAVEACGLTEVKVLRTCRNPFLVECTCGEDGIERRILVKVRSNVNFRPRMTFLARLSANESEVWAYTGRMPRFPGRW